MRLRSLLTTVLGIGIASGAVWFGQARTEDPQIAPPPQTTVEVIAAAQDIPFGTAIDAGDLTTIRWPADAVPAGAFTDTAAVLPAPGGDPRRARRPLAQGEILLASKLSEFGEMVTIVQTLGENARAIAIDVDAQSGVGGFVSPGDHVDVVLIEGRGEAMSAVTVLQNIRVIGVDQRADAYEGRPGIARTVTVEVTPDQGQRLALAQRAGRLTLTLRALDSADGTMPGAVGLADILPQEAPEAAPAPEPETRQAIRVRRGAAPAENVWLN